jgi:SAM-dependent methyltransferase
MSEAPFDFDAIFDDDYLYFYEPMLTERTEHEVDLIPRLLEVEPGAEIADVPCGHGRIANALAARGFRVTGLDASERFLELARRDAQALGVEVEYVQGDMRTLPWRERFDAVVNWFTSFGYFDDDGNRAVLSAAREALRPRGRFLVDVHNRDAFTSRFVPEGITERDGDFMLDLRVFDVAAGRIETDRVVIRDGVVRRAHFGVRMFAFTELRDWLIAAGFEDVRGYDWGTGEPMSFDTRRMVVTGRKAA